MGIDLDPGTPSSKPCWDLLLLREGKLLLTEELIDQILGQQPSSTALCTARTYICRLRRLFTGVGQGTRRSCPPRAVLPADRFTHAGLDGFSAVRAGGTQRRAPPATSPERRPTCEPRCPCGEERRWLGRVDSTSSWSGPGWSRYIRTSWRSGLCSTSIGRHNELIGEMICLVNTYPLRERAISTADARAVSRRPASRRTRGLPRNPRTCSTRARIDPGPDFAQSAATNPSVGPTTVLIHYKASEFASALHRGYHIRYRPLRNRRLSSPPPNRDESAHALHPGQKPRTSDRRQRGRPGRRPRSR